jgi:hypothetical protein
MAQETYTLIGITWAARAGVAGCGRCVAAA